MQQKYWQSIVKSKCLYYSSIDRLEENCQCYTEIHTCLHINTENHTPIISLTEQHICNYMYIFKLHELPICRFSLACKYVTVYTLYRKQKTKLKIFPTTSMYNSKAVTVFVQLDVSILTCVHAYISFLYTKHFPYCTVQCFQANPRTKTINWQKYQYKNLFTSKMLDPICSFHCLSPKFLHVSDQD